MIRKPVAGQFYNGDLREQMEAFRARFQDTGGPERINAGIVPHAGWFFSGATAAGVFFAIQARQTPSTIILLGAVHTPGVLANSLFPEGFWDTPAGPAEVDSALAADILESMPGMVAAAPEAHRYEHSIEVQVPMIKYLFPNTKILPIAVLPDGRADGFGKRLGELLRERDGIVVIGSTDLTHYGLDYGFAPAGFGPSAYEWMKRNDRRIIDLAVNMLADKIVDEAERNYNACGAGAMAAAVAYAKEKGVRNGRLLRYTTSHDEYPQGGFEMAVGYAGIIF